MIQFTASSPIYTQISERIGMQIMTAEYPAGSDLPSVRDLAADFGVNPNTMQRALSDLESRGLIDTHRTAGRTVTEDQQAIDQAKQQLVKRRAEEFIESLKVFGYSTDDLADIIRHSHEEGERNEHTGS
ncbi:MAG: GntR family transcriptional regulator [Coriobacteriia bacterium]|nr:GntR family transcriptional regulator [Coriobacteriia bacterium]